jgi:hypothetical protein
VGAKCEQCSGPIGYVSPGRRARGDGRYCSLKCWGASKRLEQTGDDLRCHRCNEIKPVSAFDRHSRNRRGYQYWCKKCIVEARKERGRPAAEPVHRRKYKLQEYGITPAQYDELFAEQGGRCAICGTEKMPWEPSVGVKGRGAFLTVDHDHVTGSVRGLLCANCNVGLGQFRDDAASLLAAVDYLARAEAAQAPECDLMLTAAPGGRQ